jgi:hypothetical protein
MVFCLWSFRWERHFISTDLRREKGTMGTIGTGKFKFVVIGFLGLLMGFSLWLMNLLTGNSHFTDGYHLHQATIRVV